jgi:surfactin synthase thioesterase subunit
MYRQIKILIQLAIKMPKTNTQTQIQSRGEVEVMSSMVEVEMIPYTPIEKMD